MARGAARRLHQRGLGAEKAFFVRVQNGDERHLGQVEPFAKQVDANEAVEITLAQFAENIDAFERPNIGMEILHAQTNFFQIVGQIFGGHLGQGCHQRPLAALSAGANFFHHIVDLSRKRADIDRRVDDTGRTNDLLNRGSPLLLLKRAGRCGGENHRAGDGFKFIKGERAVIKRGRQAKAVFDEGTLTGLIAVKHTAHLRKGYVRLIDDREKVFWEIVDQAGGPLTGLACTEVTGIVFDSAAVTDLAHHFDVVHRPHPNPLGFDQFIVLFEPLHPLLQLRLNADDGGLQLFSRHHKMLGG